MYAVVWGPESRQSSMIQGDFHFWACLFEWMLLIKETCSRVVRESHHLIVSSFLDCKFLENRVPALSIGLCTHPFICLSSICWGHTLCQMVDQKSCVVSVWECVFVQLYLFILTIAGTCLAIFVEWIMWNVPWGLCSLRRKPYNE